MTIHPGTLVFCFIPFRQQNCWTALNDKVWTDWQSFLHPRLIFHADHLRMSITDPDLQRQVQIIFRKGRQFIPVTKAVWFSPHAARRTLVGFCHATSWGASACKSMFPWPSCPLLPFPKVNAWPLSRYA
jgi:hypothetical protein